MISCFHLTLSMPGGDRPLFDDVTFEVDDGAWAEFVGPTGGGKSVLFGLLSLRLAMPQGKLLVAGRNVERLKKDALAKLRRHLGSCAQEARLLDGRTVAENLVLPLVVRGEIDGAPQRVDRILDALGVAHLRDRCAGHLSGQGRRLVGIARAAIGAPRLVLIDGGLGDLEEDSRRRAIALLEGCRAQGSTVLILTREPTPGRPGDACEYRVGDGAVEARVRAVEGGPMRREVV